MNKGASFKFASPCCVIRKVYHLARSVAITLIRGRAGEYIHIFIFWPNMYRHISELIMFVFGFNKIA